MPNMLLIEAATLSLLCAINLKPVEGLAITPAFSDCSGSEKMYTRELLVQLDIEPLEVSVSYKTGYIYIADKDRTKVFLLKKGENRVTQIVLGNRLQSIAVDNNKEKVYIASTAGIFLYNELTAGSERLPGITIDVRRIYIPHNTSDMYVLDWGKTVFYKYTNRPSDILWYLNINIAAVYANSFIVDAENNFYYITDENGHKVTKIIMREKYAPIQFGYGMTPSYDNLAVDNYGQVYATAGRHLFLLNAHNTILQFVSTLDFDPLCIGFDKDNNLIFGTKDKKILRMKQINKCNTTTTEKVDMIEKPDMTVLGKNTSTSMINDLNDKLRKQNETIHSLTLKYDELLRKLNNNVEILIKKANNESLLEDNHFEILNNELLNKDSNINIGVYSKNRTNKFADLYIHNVESFNLFNHNAHGVRENDMITTNSTEEISAQ